MKELKILATSDIHGFLVPWDFSKNRTFSGGLSRISTYLKNYDRENSILVDNGDMLQGNLLGMFNREEVHPGIVALNTMGYEVFNLGNHEFNIDTKLLKKITDNFNGATLMANIYHNGKRFFKPYTIIEKNGIKVGFIGINIPLIVEFEKLSGNLDGFEITDPAEELDRCIEELRGKTDALVGLFHMGLEDENSVKNSGILSISKNSKHFSLLDVIISGHVHSAMDSYNIGDVLVTCPGKYAECLLEIDLKFTGEGLDKSAHIIRMTEEIDGDKVLENAISRYKNALVKYSEEKVGYSICRETEMSVQLYESPIHRFLTEVMLYYSGADVVSFQIDQDESMMPRGVVRRHTIMNNYSYSGGEITNYRITGYQLKSYMEWSAEYFSFYDEARNLVILNKQRSNRKYSTNDFFGNILYEISIKNPPGSRVVFIKYLDGGPVKENDILTIGMNSYRMNKLITELPSFKENPPEEISTTAYIDSNGFERGTIQELCEKYFSLLPNRTWIDNEKIHWKIIELRN